MVGTFTSVKVIVTSDGSLQSSVAFAIPVTEGSASIPQAIFAVAGQVIIGGILSSTVIVCTHDASLPLLPHSSVAVQVRVITYSY